MYAFKLGVNSWQIQGGGSHCSLMMVRVRIRIRIRVRDSVRVRVRVRGSQSQGKCDISSLLSLLLVRVFCILTSTLWLEFAGVSIPIGAITIRVSASANDSS